MEISLKKKKKKTPWEKYDHKDYRIFLAAGRQKSHVRKRIHQFTTYVRRFNYLLVLPLKKKKKRFNYLLIFYIKEEGSTTLLNLRTKDKKKLRNMSKGSKRMFFKKKG